MLLPKSTHGSEFAAGKEAEWSHHQSLVCAVLHEISASVLSLVVPAFIRPVCKNLGE